MNGQTSERHGVRVLVLGEHGPVIADEAGATDVVGQALGDEAEVVAVPIARLDPAFTQLRSGLAGAVVQKFANYRLQLVVMGPLDLHGPPSGPLADWVREANRGRQVWFVDDVAELDRRLLGAART